jgi:hypothetical protein
MLHKGIRDTLDVGILGRSPRDIQMTRMPFGRFWCLLTLELVMFYDIYYWGGNNGSCHIGPATASLAVRRLVCLILLRMPASHSR